MRRGAFFHQTECFGPVLGMMRAETLEEAIALANDVAFGLTSALHSLDEREVARWAPRIEAGNLYVNRPTTGAIVRRQPFGGWKASSVGPGAKAGGPNYVLQLARWRQVTLPPAEEVPAALTPLLERCLAETGPPGEPVLRASAASYAAAWRAHFAVEHDPSRVPGERNVFRYVPYRGVLVRAAAARPEDAVALGQALLAAATAGVPVEVSLPPGTSAWAWLDGQEGVGTRLEDDAGLAARLAGERIERVRALAPVSPAVRAAANAAGIAVIDAPPLTAGRLELRWYVREQTVSRVVHRYGSIPGPGAP